MVRCTNQYADAGQEIKCKLVKQNGWIPNSICDKCIPDWPNGEVPKEKTPILHEISKLPPKKFPNITTQIGSAIHALGTFIVGGLKRTPECIRDERLKICSGCDELDKETNKCMACGCWVQYKAEHPLEICPLNKWPEVKREEMKKANRPNPPPNNDGGCGCGGK